MKREPAGTRMERIVSIVITGPCCLQAPVVNNPPEEVKENLPAIQKVVNREKAKVKMPRKEKPYQPPTLLQMLRYAIRQTRIACAHPSERGSVLRKQRIASSAIALNYSQ